MPPKGWKRRQQSLDAAELAAKVHKAAKTQTAASSSSGSDTDSGYDSEFEWGGNAEDMSADIKAIQD